MLNVNAIGRMAAVVAVVLTCFVVGGPQASALPGGDAPGELVIGGLPLLFQAEGFGDGDPVLARAYRFVGLELAAIGLTSLLSMAARRWMPAAARRVPK